MKKIVTIFSILLIILFSCKDSNVKIIDKYQNGEKRIIIKMNHNDTILKCFYYQNGKLWYYIPYKNNKIYGIRYEYDKDGLLKDESVLINNKLVGSELHYRDINKQDSLIKFYGKINDTTFVTRGYIKLKKGKFLKKESFFYDVSSEKDTINFDENFKFNVEIMSLGRDSIFSQISLGNINSKGEVIDTTTWQSGWKNSFNFILKPKKIGHNYIFGNIIVIIMYPEINNYGVDTLLFYKDYFVN